MADSAASLKIVIPEKVDPMPEMPTHEWYMKASPEYKKIWNFYAAASRMSGERNEFWSDARISKQIVPQLNLQYQKEYEQNQMAIQNYNSLVAMQETSEKVASEQAQATQLAQQQQAEQQQRTDARRLATQAVSQSLRMLAGMATQAGAPTATVSRPSPRGLRIRPTAARNNLRIGSSGRGSGVGMNIGG